MYMMNNHTNQMPPCDFLRDLPEPPVLDLLTLPHRLVDDKLPDPPSRLSVALRDFVFDAVDRLVGDVFDAPHNRIAN